MIPFGVSEEQSEEVKKRILRRGSRVVTFFTVAALLPVAVYLLFYFGLLEAKPRFSKSLEQTVALVNTGSATGTAFLVSPTKLLTAKHVVKGKSEGDKVELIFEKAEPQITTTGTILWIEPTDAPEPEYYLNDLAVIELENPGALPEDYPYLSLGVSEGIGTRTEVLIIGFPGGLLSTTTGTISNDNMKNLELFQLDVEAWPGNSGGPLLLEETEEVVGMLVAGLSDEFQGINFAVKVDVIAKHLEKKGIVLD